MKKRTHIYVATILIIIIAVGTVYMYGKLKQKPQLETVTVAPTTVTQGVTGSGTVVAAQNLDLSFEQGGTVAKVDVQAGDTVKAGQVLAELDTSGLTAGVSQAAAAVQASQAAYQKLVNGDTSQDIAVAQVAVENASSSLADITSQQNTLVSNAYNTLLNTSITAVAGNSNYDGIIPIITGTYTGSAEGAYNITVYQTGGGMKFNVTGLETATGNVLSQPQALGTKGLYIQFNGTPSPADTWTVSIPNTYASAYTANYNAYQNALQNQTAAVTAAQSALNSAQAALTLKETNARPEDIAAANAQVNVARAQYEQAKSSYSKSTLTSPIDGVVSVVNAKVGQTVAGSTLAPAEPAISLISNEQFQAQLFVAESDIGKIKVGDSANITLDAYGSGTNFTAQVISIDPAATVDQGIPTFKVTLQFTNNDDRIRSGMDANITITDQQEANVIAVPNSALFTDNGQSYVLVDEGNNQLQKTQVQTGIVSIDGQTEITSGLQAGQQVVSFGN